MINHRAVQEKWESAHYMLYLYLCVAKADADAPIVTEEEILILDKFDLKTNYRYKLPHKYLQEVLEEISAHNEHEISEFVKAYCANLCANGIDKNSLLSDLEDIIAADGTINAKELHRLRMIQRSLR
jgi:hypothetical protein